jgi:hypothetical protein
MTLKQLNALAGIATAVAVVGITSVYGEDSTRVALNLGSVLGSEKACGLAYDREAINRFIAEHVSATDMSFPSSLNVLTEGTKNQIESMSESSLTAHCTQIRRIAKQYGFTK